MSSIDMRNKKLVRHNETPQAVYRIQASGNGNGNKRECAVTSVTLKQSTLCLIVTMELLLLISGIATHKSKSHATQFVAIIDAGSTGSRVLVFKFHRDPKDKLKLQEQELYKESKPGLSAYAANPTEGAHSIKLLLDAARNFVPKKDWRHTPLALKATAGLRFLQPKEADDLLDAVRDVFAKSKFKIGQRAVEIMDGHDEGIFSWITVNFLLGHLNQAHQLAALDLGGGSTQVTFPLNRDEELASYENDIFNVITTNKNINVFAHSYLGLGLQAARHAVFTHNSKDTKLKSICVHPSVTNHTWVYNNVAYEVAGEHNHNGIVDYANCLKLIQHIVLPKLNPKPITLKRHNLVAFSYYFVRGFQAKLIDPETGGETSVFSFRQKAKEFCGSEIDISLELEPFMCFDLLYISVLLLDGFGLPKTNKIGIYQKVNGHQISWALGAAFSLLKQDKKERPTLYFHV